MIADTVEAAVRSKIHSVNNVSELTNFVHSLIIDKFNDNQLNDSMLKIKDLETMAYSFIDVFKGMYGIVKIYQKERANMNKENKESENKKWKYFLITEPNMILIVKKKILLKM